MQSNSKILELGKKLPLGAKKLIAKRTGLTEKTVDNILKSKTNGRMDNIIKVVQEAKNVLAEYEAAIKL